MTDLISRPRRPEVPTRDGAAAPAARSLVLTAGIAALASAAISLALCCSLALLGWFLADAGAHGSTPDALRVGAGMWLLALGAHLQVAGLPVGIVPLGLTLMLAVVAWRCGRWAARQGAADSAASVPLAVAVHAGGYTVVAVLLAVTASGYDASLPGAVLGALLLAGLAGGGGIVLGSGWLRDRLADRPAWIAELGLGAVSGALLLLGAGGLLAGTSILLSFNEAATVISRLGLDTGDAVSYAAVVAALSPNVAALGVSWLIGPGFAVGVGTTVSPTAVSLGAVPAFPVLAGLPAEGAPPDWLVAVLAVPALAAAAGAWIAARAGAAGGSGPAPYDLAALRGAGAGLGAGLLVTAVVALAGGSLGTGRLTEIGAPVSEVLVFATGLMSVGGLLGGLGATWWLKRR